MANEIDPNLIVLEEHPFHVRASHPGQPDLYLRTVLMYDMPHKSIVKETVISTEPVPSVGPNIVNNLMYRQGATVSSKVLMELATERWRQA